MNENMRESLSALMDDEANELELERILASASKDPELRAAWARYHQSRDAVAGQPVAHGELDISRQVLAAISGSPEGGLTARAKFRQRVLRPVASFAVAASVAATVVIGGQQLAQVGNTDPYSAQRTVAAIGSPVGMLNSLGATTVRASYGTQSAVPALLPATRTAYQELARQRMGRYMQEHAEHAALNSPHGLIPYARVPRIRE
ncbi:MAG: sigma-E factor negative regulatory protein RseA [Halioglobus sp.]|jgi:sigma-E factor negative regulatory protein RseA